MTTPMQERIAFGVAEVAAMLGVSASHVRNLAARKQLATLRFGERLLIERESLARMLYGDSHPTDSFGRTLPSHEPHKRCDDCADTEKERAELDAVERQRAALHAEINALQAVLDAREMEARKPYDRALAKRTAEVREQNRLDSERWNGGIQV